MTTIIVAGTVLVCIAAIAALAVRAYARFCKRDLERLRHLERWRAEFFDSIRPLIEDGETPEELLLTIRSTALHIETSPQGLYFSMMRAMASGPKPQSKFTPEMDMFFERRAELRESFYRFLRSFVLSVSFNDNRWGPLLRSQFAEVLADPNKKQAVVQTVRALRNSNDKSRDHMSDGCLIPA